MKKFAMLSFLFIAIVIASSEVRFCRADASPAAVLDTDGKKLRAGENYYILPAFNGTGGGFVTGNIRRGYDGCRINIVQEPSEQFKGFPATFAPINPKKGVVRVSTDLNIQFDTFSRCGKSTVWTLGKFDRYLRQFFVTIGGVKGNPGRETVGNWFKIENNGSDYKLVHCPTVCKYCKVLCKDIGMFENEGKRALVLSDTPFPVVFKRV